MRILQITTVAIAATGLISSYGQAATPSEHPAYVHALVDLKLAQSAIIKRGGAAGMVPHEKLAIQHIEAAQNIIYHAAPQEQKNLTNLPGADEDPSKKLGGLHDAKAYLQKAQADLNEAESDTALLPARKRAVAEVDSALYEVGTAINDFEHHK